LSNIFIVVEIPDGWHRPKNSGNAKIRKKDELVSWGEWLIG